MIGLGLSIYEEALEVPEDVIRELCEKTIEYAPEYDEKEIKKNWINSSLATSEDLK